MPQKQHVEANSPGGSKYIDGIIENSGQATKGLVVTPRK